MFDPLPLPPSPRGVVSLGCVDSLLCVGAEKGSRAAAETPSLRSQFSRRRCFERIAIALVRGGSSLGVLRLGRAVLNPEAERPEVFRIGWRTNAIATLVRLAWVFGRSLHAILGHPEMGGLCVQMMAFELVVCSISHPPSSWESGRAAAWQHGLMCGRGVRYIE